MVRGFSAEVGRCAIPLPCGAGWQSTALPLCLPQSKLSHKCALAALANDWQSAEHSGSLVQMEAEWLCLSCWISLQRGFCTVVMTYLLFIEIECCSGLTVLGLINSKLKPVIWYDIICQLGVHRSYPCPFPLVLMSASSPVLLPGCPELSPNIRASGLPALDGKCPAWLYELLKCSL